MNERSPSPAPGWRRLLTPAALAAAPAMAAAAVDLIHLGSPTVPAGDLALTMWDTDRAEHLRLLVGPYSRFRWHHPGPVLSYWLAPFWWLSNHHLAGLAVGTAVLSALLLAAMVVAVGRATGTTQAWATAAVLLVVTWRYGFDQLRELWNPAAAVLPLVAVAVFGAAVAAGRRWWLPAVFVVASVAAQSHVGAVPVAVVFVVVTVAGAGWAFRHRARELLAPAAVALVLTGICWSPSMYEEVTRHPGNATLLVRFVKDQTRTRHSWSQVGAVTRRMMPITMGGLGTLVRPVTRPPPRHDPGLTEDLGLAVLAAGAATAVVVGIRRRRPVLVSLGVATVAGAIGAILPLRSVNGVLYFYLAFPAVAVGMLGWVTIGVTVASSGPVQRLRRRLSWGTGTPRLALIGPAAVVVLAAACFVAAARLPSSDQLHDNPTAARLARSARRAVEPFPPGSRVLVDSDQTGWPVAAAIAQQLQQHGYSIAARPNWQFLYDDSTRLNGKEAVRVLVLATRTPERGLLGRGDRLTDRASGLDLYVGR